ncbi:MAG: ATP-binding protein [bacterium]
MPCFDFRPYSAQKPFKKRGLGDCGPPVSRIFFIALWVILTACLANGEGRKQPLAEKGVLDLRGWDLKKDGLVNLNGEWQFYWEKQLDPGDFKKSVLPVQTGYMNLPRIWNGYPVDGRELSGHGFATFRLEIRMDPAHDPLALKINDMATAYRIWVDERQVLSNGTVGETLETMKPEFLPKVARIGFRSERMVLTLQVSNFRHKKGGAWMPIELGIESQIREKQERAVAFELFLFGSLLIMAFYHAGLYLFRRKDPSPLFLSLVCLMAGLRGLLVGERFLIRLYPTIDWEIYQKLEYITFFLSISFFHMFLTSLFPEFSKRLGRTVLMVSFLISLFTLIVPARIFSYELVVYHFFLVGLTIYLFVIFPRILLNRREGAIWVVLGVVVLLITVFIDILAVNDVVTTINISSIGLFIFIFFESVMLSMRFARSLTAMETLSDALTQTNQQKDAILTALKQSEHKYRQLVENMDDVFFMVDLEGRFSYVSPAADSVFGYPVVELQGTIASDYVVPEDIKSVLDVISKTRKGISSHIECRIYSKSGNVRWVRFHGRPMVTAGKIIGAQGILSDITDRKRTQELMLQTEKMVSVGGLAAGMAHELNNPLAGILQAAQNIVRRLSSDLKTNIETAEQCGVDLGRLRDYLEKRQILYYLSGIKESGERASEIIKNMLHFSRKSGSQKTPVNLAALVMSTVELAKTDYDLKKNYDFRNIEITRTFEEGLPDVQCNKTEIEQVVFNLIKNAAQAMSGGQADRKPHIHLRLMTAKDRVRLEVDDNGPGIPETQRKRIFEPFFTTKPEGIGTGLGLSVSYMIVTKNHQGTIEVESEPGEGTRFIIHIPITSEIQSSST